MARKQSTADRLCDAMTDWTQHLRECLTCKHEVERKAGGFGLSLCPNGTKLARLILLLVGRQGEEFRAEITKPVHFVNPMAVPFETACGIPQNLLDVKNKNISIGKTTCKKCYESVRGQSL